MKIGCKIESVVGVNFKKLIAKIVNLIFKYILSSYFIECGWRCSYRRLSLLGFAHPVVGPPFQVQVRCRRLTLIWDSIWDESRTQLVLFCFCLVLH